MNKSIKIVEHLKYMHEPSASVLLLFLLSTDFAFILLHTIEFMSTSLDNPLLSLEKDQGYPEVYQYIKWYWIIIQLIFISIKTRSVNYSAWGFFFTFLLLDDMLEIHEGFGELLSKNLSLTLPLGLRVEDIGELMVAATAGIVLLLIVFFAYTRGSHAFKKMSIDILLLFVALAFFGVIVDVLHVIAYYKIGWKVSAILAVIEDGGEMIVASLFVWYVFLFGIRNENATSYLSDFLRKFMRLKVKSPKSS